jgi:CheY-like chemotaxis protein
LGLTLAQQLRPVAVTLDTRLPDMAGQSVLYRLKRESHLRHIPVHVISDDADWRHCLLLGAASHSLKPANEEDLGELVHKIQTSLEPRSKNLLLVGCGNGWCERLSQLIGDSRVKTLQCETAGQALERLANAPFDCVALDSKLPDSPAHKLIRDIQTQTERRRQAIIVHDGGRCDEKELWRATQDGVVGRVHSMERLLEETTRVLHLAEADLPEPARQILADLRQRDTVPRDAVILIVDDDVRTIFALTTVLERYHIQVLHADSGAAGIQMLGNTPDIDCVLMDVMMPEMDGYETMRAIRQVPRFRALPIIAVTAKAMKGDREKCMEAGGSDYITKPLDPTELLSLLRVWLPFHAHECIPGHQSLDEVKQMAS